MSGGGIGDTSERTQMAVKRRCARPRNKLNGVVLCRCGHDRNAHRHAQPAARSLTVRAARPVPLVDSRRGDVGPALTVDDPHTLVAE